MPITGNGKMQFASEEELKTRLEAGDLIETPDQMSEAYIKGLKRILTVSADTELMSAPSYTRAAKHAPSINASLSAMAIVQDELGHANIAYRLLEDLGFEAVDNLPLKLLKKLVAGLDDSPEETKLAVGIDIRGRDFDPAYFFQKLNEVSEVTSLAITTLFVDCDDATLIGRYKETRRPHPLAPDRPIADGLKLERRLISDIRDRADVVIDSGPLQPWQFKDRMRDIFGTAGDGMSTTVMSFAFKKGLPREADLVFDVRFLANPHYDPDLRPLSGLDKEVGEVVSKDVDFASYVDSLKTMLALTVPRFEKEGKSHLTIAVGCTGGRHRSVFITETLASWLPQLQDHKVHRHHRDLVTKSG